jgi:hypothetical protein
MALTLTDPNSLPRIERLGRRKRVTKLVTFDSSYDTGGESLTPAMFGLTAIDDVQAQPAGGYAFEYDYTNQILKARPTTSELTEVVTKAAATDGGGTSGFKDFAGTIPAGALILGWRVVTTVAWSGDTTAVMIVGVSGDTDRFTADTATASVFATGIDGSNALAADAADGIAAAVTPRVTITSSADFTNTNALASSLVSVLFVMPTLPTADLATALASVRVTATGY